MVRGTVPRAGPSPPEGPYVGFDARKIAQEALRQAEALHPEGSIADQVVEIRRRFESGIIPTAVPLLPLFLNLKGQPYEIEKEHYQFEPFYNFDIPQKILFVCARQLGKTTNEGSQAVAMTASIPEFHTLIVTPLQEQIRRISNDVVRPFIDRSPVRSLLLGDKRENRVLHRVFRNNSSIYFNFAGLDVDRVRGTSVDKVAIDEIQDIHIDHLPIILECMSASKRWRLAQMCGTPKTPENTINRKWKESSRAEWFVPCLACGKMNIASIEYDLDAMIGPYREDISADNPATVCAKCRRPINPRLGRWVHRSKEKARDFAGYHLPQPVTYAHYSDAKMWAELLAKREGFGNYTPAKYHNEVLGESYGEGVQLVSEDEIKAACVLPWQNRPRDYQSQWKSLQKELDRYQTRVLAVDWGGGGEKRISLTALAVLGFRAGVIDVLWGRRLLTPHAHLLEAEECRHVFRLFKCHLLAHDYSGAGVLREQFLRHKGLELPQLVPIAYIGAARGPIMRHHKATSEHPRNFYRVDKSRSLLLTCNAIKFKMLRFFQYDWRNTDDPGLLQDFLALMENKVETAVGSDVYTVVRNEEFPDDFAQAVNIGCCCLWYRHKAWPEFGSIRALEKANAQLKELDERYDWTDEQDDVLEQLAAAGGKKRR